MKKFVATSILIILLVFSGYKLSIDLWMVPLKVVFPRDEMQLIDVSPNGKFGIATDGYLIFFDEKYKEDTNQRLDLIINDRLVLLKQNSSFELSVFNIETRRTVSVEEILGTEIELVSLEEEVSSSQESYLHNGMLMLIDSDDKVKIYHLLYNQTISMKDTFPGIVELRNSLCYQCVSPNGKYILNGNTVTTVNGQKIFSLEEFGPIINVLFSKRHLDLYGWASDSSGIYGSYGKTYLLKLPGIPIGTKVIPLEQAIIKIPIPFP